MNGGNQLLESVEVKSYCSASDQERKSGYRLPMVGFVRMAGIELYRNNTV